MNFANQIFNFFTKFHKIFYSKFLYRNSKNSTRVKSKIEKITTVLSDNLHRTEQKHRKYIFAQHKTQRSRRMQMEAKKKMFLSAEQFHNFSGWEKIDLTRELWEMRKCCEECDAYDIKCCRETKQTCATQNSDENISLNVAKTFFFSCIWTSNMFSHIQWSGLAGGFVKKFFWTFSTTS